MIDKGRFQIVLSRSTAELREKRKRTRRTKLCAAIAKAWLSGSILIAGSIHAQIAQPPLGIITTVAGSGTSGSTGDGGLATSAELGSRGCSIVVEPGFDAGHLRALLSALEAEG